MVKTFLKEEALDIDNLAKLNSNEENIQNDIELSKDGYSEEDLKREWFKIQEMRKELNLSYSNKNISSGNNYNK